MSKIDACHDCVNVIMKEINSRIFASKDKNYSYLCSVNKNLVTGKPMVCDIIRDTEKCKDFKKK